MHQPVKKNMNIFLPTDENLLRAVSVLKSGGVISFPTETVYGLGADAFNPKAVACIFEVKKRPFFDPLIVHIASLEQINMLVSDVPASMNRLAERFWPGPLTLIFKKKESVPDIVTAGLDTVAVRMPSHPVARRLIELLGSPIAAPSANRFGSISPTEAIHVREQLGNSVDMIIDGGPCEIGIESTIIKINGDSAELLRPGGVPLELLSEELAAIHVIDQTSMVEAPGQLPYHYSPVTPVKLVNRISSDDIEHANYAFLFFKKPELPIDDRRAFILSQSGDLREAATNLFSALHRLDKIGADVILAEHVPGHGLGRAIMDRLLKASNKSKRGAV